MPWCRYTTIERKETHAEIPLYNQKGQEKARALISLCDVDYLEKLNLRWYLTKKGYVQARGRNKAKADTDRIWLHRLLLQATGDMDVDHINRDPLDNRRENIRLASHKQNMNNLSERRRDNTSGYRGVYWDKTQGVWYARFRNKYVKGSASETKEETWQRLCAYRESEA